MSFDIVPEAEFLTYCCREDANGEWQIVIKKASRVRNWDLVIELSAQHGVSLLLLPTLKKLAQDGHIPESVALELRNVGIREVVRISRLRSALGELLPAFKEAKVPVVVLKGFALTTMLYFDAAVRPSQDIDILCKEEDFPGARDALISLGYIEMDDSVLPAKHSHHETYLERHFLHPDGLVQIELHVDSIKLGVRPSHYDSIWERVVEINIDGQPALALSPEDQVLMLSIHLHRHGFNRLIWFKDIDLFLRRYERDLDWELIFANAKAEGAESSLWYTFRLLGKMFNSPVSDDAISRLKPNPFIRWTLGRIWQESDVLNLRSQTKRRAVQFSVSESWHGIIPSLILMGRRREKVSILIHRFLHT